MEDDPTILLTCPHHPGSVEKVILTPRSARFFPTLKDVVREFLTPADWERIFNRKSDGESDQKERQP